MLSLLHFSNATTVPLPSISIPIKVIVSPAAQAVQSLAPFNLNSPAEPLAPCVKSVLRSPIIIVISFPFVSPSNAVISVALLLAVLNTFPPLISGVASLSIKVLGLPYS